MLRLKLNKNFILYIIILFLFPVYLISQNTKLEFQDGKIIEGDMEFKDWSRTPNKVNIKVDGEVKLFEASQINGLEYYGVKYIRKTVEINTNTQNLQNITDGIVLTSEEKEIFLKVVVLGKVSFYSSFGIRNHFFVSKDDKFIELIKVKRATKGPINRYIGHLNLMFSDCDTDIDFEKINFDESSIKKAVIKYNSCGGGESSYISKIKKGEYGWKTDYYLVGGVKISSYNFSNNSFYEAFEISSDNQINPSFGVALDINLLSRSKKLKLHNGLLFQKYRFDASLTQEASFVQTLNNFVSIDLNYIELNNLLKYSLARSSAESGLFLNAGLTHSFLISDNSSEFAESIFLDDVTRIDLDPLDGGIKSYILSLSVGAGFKYKFANIEFRYNIGSSITNGLVKTNFNNINALVSISPF